MYKVIQNLRTWFTERRQWAQAEIRLTEDGFEVASHWRVKWSDVKEVFAFKQDLLTTDRVCLGFRVSDQGDYLRVDEEMPGYSDLVEKMQEVLPDYKKEWWMKVAFPAFSTNFTTVWKAQ